MCFKEKLHSNERVLDQSPLCRDPTLNHWGLNLNISCTWRTTATLDETSLYFRLPSTMSGPLEFLSTTLVHHIHMTQLKGELLLFLFPECPREVIHSALPSILLAISPFEVPFYFSSAFDAGEECVSKKEKVFTLIR
jgi:hypothetical protein